MKILVASDIHGSAYWANRVAEKFAETQSDVLVLLGDIYNHGPRNPFPKDYLPMKTAEILNGMKDNLVVIRGNCDSEVDQMISEFTFVNDETLIVPKQNGVRRLFFTHGHIFNKDNLPCLQKGDVLFYGHFHKTEVTQKDGVWCVNVNSCALPKDGEPTYCLVDEKGFAIFNFENFCLIKQPF